MAELLLSIILAVIFGSFALTIFPSFNPLWRSVDTSNMLPLVKLIIASIPYDFLFVVFYTCIHIVKNKITK